MWVLNFKKILFRKAKKAKKKKITKKEKKITKKKKKNEIKLLQKEENLIINYINSKFKMNISNLNELLYLLIVLLSSPSSSSSSSLIIIISGVEKGRPSSSFFAIFRFPKKNFIFIIS